MELLTNIPKALYGALLAGVIVYFILFFTEDLLNLHKRWRISVAILCGFLYYHFGENISVKIRAFFTALGL
jgi:hypothetical protein